MDSRLLTENGWKTILAQCRISDNGLRRALAAYGRFDDEEHDERLAAITSIIQLAGALKRAREVATVPQVVSYLTDMLAAAEAEKRVIVRAKADAARETQTSQEDGDDEAEGAYHEKLLAALLKLKSSHNLSYQFIVCDARPYCALMVAKHITPQHKEELTALTGGSRRFMPLGTCRCDGARYSFSMERPVTGLARKLQDSVKHFTGKRFEILVGTEPAQDDIAEPAQQPASEADNSHTGQGVQSPAPASPRQPTCAAPSTPTAAASPVSAERSATAARPTLENAPQAWRQAMRLITARIDQLKTSIRREFAHDDPGLLAEIEGNISYLDQAIRGLDHRLADSLTQAQSAQSPVARTAELTRARGILVEYINFVKSEPLIAQIDANPFGVRVNLKGTLTAILTHIAQAIRPVGPAVQH